MRQLYLDCAMGAAGDMLGAALLELTPNPEDALAELNALALPGVEYSREQSRKCGVLGTRLLVRVHGREEEADAHGHGHSHGATGGLAGIERLVRGLPLSDSCREHVLAVYRLLAEAESRVHGVPVPEIHFHELGTMDAVADIVAVCRLMERLAPDEVLASPVHVGSGSVRCAHGVLPVPAPATALLLEGIPIYGGEIAGELCTPTGAALLRHFVTRFGALPVTRVSAIGYGLGKKDFPRLNAVRALLGETEQAQERVVLLSCNLDDMSAEEIGFATERLFEGGALDVYTVPIGMKKNRPGTLLCVIARPDEREGLLRLLFRHTTTLGVRLESCERCVLARRTETRQSRFGQVRVKLASGYGVSREKIEYEDLARLARAEGLSLRAVREAVQKGDV